MNSCHVLVWSLETLWVRPRPISVCVIVCHRGGGSRKFQPWLQKERQGTRCWSCKTRNSHMLDFSSGCRESSQTRQQRLWTSHTINPVRRFQRSYSGHDKIVAKSDWMSVVRSQHNLKLPQGSIYVCVGVHDAQWWTGVASSPSGPRINHIPDWLERICYWKWICIYIFIYLSTHH